jgi:hypothetical protein
MMWDASTTRNGHTAPAIALPVLHRLGWKVQDQDIKEQA